MSFLSARTNAGLTQAAAAEALGVKAAAVCQWEKGETFPSAKRLEKIAELYGCTVDCLFKKDAVQAAVDQLISEVQEVGR